MDLFRSLLFIPGNQPKMLEKASHFLPDVYIPDLEDSVGDNDKTDARKIVSENIRLFKESDKLIIPRVNSLESGLFEDDIAALISKGINGVSVGKIYDAEDIVQIDKIISTYEENLNMQIGSLSLIPWIETASGILESKAILKSSVRIKAAAFGAEDFTNDMGIERQADNSEIQVAKSYLAIAARACGVTALDNPFFDFKNSSALVEDCINSKKMGYKGKFAIHPDQIDDINKSFSPSKSDVEHARKVIQVFKEAIEQGRGSTSLNGYVIDVPVYKRAQNLIELAKKLGVI